LEPDNHANYLEISLPTSQQVNYNSIRKTRIFIKVMVIYFENYIERSIQCWRKRAQFVKITKDGIEIDYCNLRNYTLKTM
jgi:lipopolysaccharide export system protein LptC